MMRKLFQLEDTEKRHPSVALWFDSHKSQLGAIALHWFNELRRCGIDVNEVLHDGQPTVCVNGAAFAYVGIYNHHVNVGFFQGSELPDAQGLLVGSGKFMRHVKLSPDVEVNTAALLELINSAYIDVKKRIAMQSS